MKLVIASQNPGKIKEFKNALKNLPYEILSLKDLNISTDAEETSDTFIGNAIQKATFYANLTNLPCISDDSGLEVEKLNNHPGVFSARWTGEHADDETNNKKLIEEMNKIHADSSPARYVSAIALVYPNGEKITVEEDVKGTIKTVPHGDYGFSYDKYFYFTDNKTFADITAEEKNKISHRGKALKALVEKLK